MTRVVKLGNGLNIGDGSFNIIAGPCSVESFDQMDSIGKKMAENGVKILRGGIFKPRTNPESFQGLGLKGLEILKEIKKKYGFIVSTEIMDIKDLEDMEEIVDVFQVGSRNMQNFSLLKDLGHINKPIILKRGMSATMEEWINAAKYIEMGGNKDIIMCERGIRTFENYTRNTLDLMTIPIIKEKTEYPIIIDPSHGTGRRELIKPASIGGKAMGADGIIVEFHPSPEDALSDGDQSLHFEEFDELVKALR